MGQWLTEFGGISANSNEMNKLIINGEEYELKETGAADCSKTPSVMLNGKHYVGQAVVNNCKKDYEILTSMASSGTPHEHRPFSCRRDACKIHSVKRLPDGEVFTIGDKCIEKDHKCVIKRFEPEPDRLVVWLSDDMDSSPFLGTALKWVNKLKEFLFTTDDNVDITTNDHCFEVHSDFKWYDVSYYEGASKNPACKYFYYSTNRDEYILMNKPCLSVNDCEQTRLKDGLLGDTLIKKLKELAKEKINATK